MFRAEILAIGDELLSGDTVNTNATFLATRCRAIGLEVRRALTVRDRVEEIVAAVRSVAAAADICLVCGGLGPTTDDRTTEAIALAAGVPVVRDADALQRLEAKFRSFRRTMPEANKKQADFPVEAKVLPNPIGTAEGFAVEVPIDGQRSSLRVFVMPGVPRELRRMMTEQIEPQLQQQLDLHPIHRRVYRLLGMGESAVAQKLEPIIAKVRERSPGLAAMFVHYRATMPELIVNLEATPDARGVAATAEELRGLDVLIAEAVDPALYGIGEPLLAERLVGALRRANLRFGTAESCSGGGAAQLMTTVAGASEVLDGGIVSYSNEVKTKVLGVPASMLREYGAVSEPVARAMAEGARRALGSDLCVSITGIAGPGGGSPEKPVGTVHFAVCDADGVVHRRLRLLGNRGTVQRSAALWALKLAWDRLREKNLAAVEDMTMDGAASTSASS